MAAVRHVVRGISFMVVAVACSAILAPASALAAYTGTVGKNLMQLTGGSAGDELNLSITADGLLEHNRYAAGDSGFASARDFDTSRPGTQTVRADAGRLAINAGAGDDAVVLPTGVQGALASVNLGTGDDRAEFNCTEDEDRATLTRSDEVTSFVCTERTTPLTVRGAEHFAVRLYDGDDQLRLSGDSSDLTVNAGAGDDVVQGVTSTGRYAGGPGSDTLRNAYSLHGEGGDDVLVGSAKPDQMLGGPGSDRMYGEGGSDRMRGDAGSDLLEGGTGDDWLEDGSGEDRLFGGIGDDILIAPDTADEADTYSGGEGRDRVSYMQRSVGITLSAAEGGLSGEAGENDQVGPGNDVEQVVGTPRADQITIGGPVSVETGGGDDTVLTGDAGDRVLVTNGRATVRTRGGNDTVEAGAGGMVIADLGDGNDNARLGPGGDQVDGGAGNDTIDAGPGGNTVRGGLGNDSLQGRGNLHGEQGNDTIRAAEGATLNGGPGNDRLFADIDSRTARHTILGGTGNDVIQAAGGGDTIRAGAGNDRVVMRQSAVNVVYGNRIYGDAGNDQLTGLPGSRRNRWWGGAGNDRMRLRNGVREVQVSGGPGVDHYNADRCDPRSRDHIEMAAVSQNGRCA